MNKQQQIEDKEQQIEEFQNDIIDNLFNGGTYGLAEALYNAGYRKLPEDSVVLSREEYEKLKYTWITDSDAYKKGCKETAEKLLNDFKLWAREYQYKDTVVDENGERPMTNNEKLNYLYTYLCDKYKVEIKENKNV